MLSVPGRRKSCQTCLLETQGEDAKKKKNILGKTVYCRER